MIVLAFRPVAAWFCTGVALLFRTNCSDDA
jgi:hypothetical protein